MADLPAGFVLDKPTLKVPEGFVLDKPAANADVSPDLLEGKSRFYKFAAGAGKGMTDVARGLGQIAGLVDQESIDAAKSRDAQLMQSGWGQAGNIAGATAALAPTMLVPGANTMAGATLLGAATGAIEPVASDESRLEKTLFGAAGSLGGDLATRGLARVLNPRTGQAVTDLLDQGVTPTPGQVLGPTAARMESALESFPFIGPTITRSKNAVSEEFNSSVLNRALSQIGQQSDGIGREAIDDAFTKVSRAYDDALAQIPQIDPDFQFDVDLQRIRQGANALSNDVANQLDRILTNRVENKLTSAVPGDRFKQIHSDVLRLARQYRSAADPDHREMSALLDDVAGSLSSLVARNNPAAAEGLRSADSAYAMLLRAAKASANSAEGTFTPRQLSNAIKAMDRSSNKVQFSRGNALLQDMSDAGQAVLGNNLPNSGTADRALLAAALAGKATPGAVAGAVGTLGAYSDPGRRLLAAILARRPEGSRAAGEFVRRLSPVSAIAAGQATNQ